MNKTVLLAIAFWAVANITPSTLADNRQQLKPSQAVQIARQEVKRRNIVLPKDHKATVSEGDAVFEFERPRKIYVVKIVFRDPSKRRVTLTVHVDKRSGKIDAFSDSRRLKPLRY